MENSKFRLLIKVEGTVNSIYQIEHPTSITKEMVKGLIEGVISKTGDVQSSFETRYPNSGIKFTLLEIDTLSKWF